VRAVLRPEPLEPRLEDGQHAERSFVQELAHGQEVRVPAAVLVHGQRDSELLGQADYLAGRISIRRERLVADDRQAQTQHLLGKRDVGGDRRGDRHRLGSRAGPVRQRGEDRAAEVLGDLAAALG
jgi:hypothetical protein